MTIQTQTFYPKRLPPGWANAGELRARVKISESGRVERVASSVGPEEDISYRVHGAFEVTGPQVRFRGTGDLVVNARRFLLFLQPNARAAGFESDDQAVVVAVDRATMTEPLAQRKAFGGVKSVSITDAVEPIRITAHYVSGFDNLLRITARASMAELAASTPEGVEREAEERETRRVAAAREKRLAAYRTVVDSGPSFVERQLLRGATPHLRTSVFRTRASYAECRAGWTQLMQGRVTVSAPKPDTDGSWFTELSGAIVDGAPADVPDVTTLPPGVRAFELVFQVVADGGTTFCAVTVAEATSEVTRRTGGEVMVEWLTRTHDMLRTLDPGVDVRHVIDIPS